MTRAIALALLLAIAAAASGCGAFDVGRAIAVCSFNPHDCN
jgi:hypothetical protein